MWAHGDSPLHNALPLKDVTLGAAGGGAADKVSGQGHADRKNHQRVPGVWAGDERQRNTPALLSQPLGKTVRVLVASAITTESR